MSEADAVERVEDPVTVDRIAADFRALGVEAGDTLLVHSSLRELGWVAGGPQAVVDALQRVLTPQGSLVMPAHSTQYSDPSVWSRPLRPGPLARANSRAYAALPARGDPGARNGCDS
jgi:Aminoglycoside N3''-acetyltransferase